MTPEHDNSTNPQDWFNSLAPVPIPPPNKKCSKRAIILIVCCILIVTLVAVAIFFPSKSTIPCLTKADYQALTGVSYGDSEFSPKTRFYTYTIYFADNEATYRDDAATSGPEIINTIGDFYKNHTKQSILIQVEVDHTNDKDVALARQRLNTVVNSLKQAGVSEAALVKSSPLASDAEEDAETITTATVSITSPPSCKS